MARQEKVFYECQDMSDIAEKVMQNYGQWFGEEYIDSSDIWFALISGVQGKRSPDIYTDKNSKQWLQKQTKKKWCIAIWQERWDPWSTEKKNWKIFEALLKIAGIKPDISGHSFMFKLLGWNWQQESDDGLKLPSLFTDSTQKLLQLPSTIDPTDEPDDSEDSSEEETKEIVKVKLLKTGK